MVFLDSYQSSTFDVFFSKVEILLEYIQGKYLRRVFKESIYKKNMSTWVKNSMMIYVILCRGGKFFIRSVRRNTDYEVLQYFNRINLGWLKIHRPLSVIEKVLPFVSTENDVVRRYMYNHGISNVRGGFYSRIKLRKYEVQNLTWQIYGEPQKNNTFKKLPPSSPSHYRFPPLSPPFLAQTPPSKVLLEFR